MTSCLNFIYGMLQSLFTFQLPWGIAFGSVIVGLFGAPLLVRAFKKFF